jgi:hypothetical protein
MSIKNIAIIITALLFIGGGFLIFLKGDENDVLENEPEEVIEEINEELTKDIKDILVKAREIDSLVYDVTMKKFGEDFSSKFWEKKENMRMDVLFKGRTMINLWNREEEVGYLYTAGDTTATEINFEQAKDIFSSSTKQWVEDALNYDLVVIKKEKVNNKDCLLLKYDKKEGEVKIWVWEEYGLPIKVISQEEWGVVEILIENIEISDIPDTMFHLPLGTKVIEELIYF